MLITVRNDWAYIRNQFTYETEIVDESVGKNTAYQNILKQYKAKDKNHK